MFVDGLDLEIVFWFLAVLVAVPLLLMVVVGFLLLGNRLERKNEPDWRTIEAPPPPQDVNPPSEAESLGQRPPREAESPPKIDRRLIKPPSNKFGSIALAGVAAAVLALGSTTPAIILLCVVGLAYGLRYIQRSRALADRGEVAKGRIVDLEIVGEDEGLDSDFDVFASSSSQTRFVYRFCVADRPGEEYEGKFKAGNYRNSAMAIGKTVRIRYLPSDPRISTLEEG